MLLDQMFEYHGTTFGERTHKEMVNLEEYQLMKIDMLIHLKLLRETQTQIQDSFYETAWEINPETGKQFIKMEEQRFDYRLLADTSKKTTAKERNEKKLRDREKCKANGQLYSANPGSDSDENTSDFMENELEEENRDVNYLNTKLITKDPEISLKVNFLNSIENPIQQKGYIRNWTNSSG